MRRLAGIAESLLEELGHGRNIFRNAVTDLTHRSSSNLSDKRPGPEWQFQEGRGLEKTSVVITHYPHGLK
jgi:hypothetical protein